MARRAKVYLDYGGGEIVDVCIECSAFIGDDCGGGEIVDVCIECSAIIGESKCTTLRASRRVQISKPHVKAHGFS